MKNFTATPSWARSLLTLSMGWWLCTAYGTLQGSATQEELVVKRLVVVDDEDRARIVIGQDPEGTQRRSRHVGITLHDPDGAERMGLGLMDDGSVGIGLDAPSGVGAPMRDRLGLRVSAEETTVLVCGPKILNRVAAWKFLQLHVPAHRVYVSLERNMNCGFGRCGHCQYGSYFVCKDGPVFCFADVANIFAKEEI